MTPLRILRTSLLPLRMQHKPPEVDENAKDTTDALRTTLKNTAKNQCLKDAYDVKEVTDAMEDITDAPEDTSEALEDAEDAPFALEDGLKATLKTTAENRKFQKNDILGLLTITNCFSWIDANVVSKCKFCSLF